MCMVTQHWYMKSSRTWRSNMKPLEISVVSKMSWSLSLSTINPFHYLGLEGHKDKDSWLFTSLHTLLNIAMEHSDVLKMYFQIKHAGAPLLFHHQLVLSSSTCSVRPQDMQTWSFNLWIGGKNRSTTRCFLGIPGTNQRHAEHRSPGQCKREYLSWIADDYRYSHRRTFENAFPHQKNMMTTVQTWRCTPTKLFWLKGSSFSKSSFCAVFLKRVHVRFPRCSRACIAQSRYYGHCWKEGRPTRVAWKELLRHSWNISCHKALFAGCLSRNQDGFVDNEARKKINVCRNTIDTGDSVSNFYLQKKTNNPHFSMMNSTTWTWISRLPGRSVPKLLASPRCAGVGKFGIQGLPRFLGFLVTW